MSVRQNLQEKRVAEQDGPLPTDPHELDFAKKRRLFEKLAKDLEPPTTLQEGQIRDHLSKIYGSEEGDEEAEARGWSEAKWTSGSGSFLLGRARGGGSGCG